MSLYVPCPIPWSCYVRAEALFDRRQGHGYAVRCEVLGLCSIPGRPLQVHVRLENGALWWRVPINMLLRDAGELLNGEGGPLDTFGLLPGLAIYAAHPSGMVPPLHHLQLWDCFDAPMQAYEVPGLAHRIMAYRRADEWVRGEYLFTVDWALDEYGDNGHKCGHVIAGEDGFYAVQPNNRVCSYDPATVTPFCETGRVPAFKVRTYNDSCEMRSEGTGDGYHYDSSGPGRDLVEFIREQNRGKPVSHGATPLPVRCGDCGWCHDASDEMPGSFACVHGESPETIEGSLILPAKQPPSWCPLRKAQHAALHLTHPRNATPERRP